MKWLLVTGDVVAAVLAFFVAYALRNTGPLRTALDTIQQPIGVYLTALPFAVILLVAIFRLRGLYHPRQRATFGREALAVTQAVVLWVLLIAAGSYFVKYDYSRLIVVLLGIATAACTIAVRGLIGWFTLKRAPASAVHTRVCIIGTGRPAKLIAQQLAPYRRHGYHVVGSVGAPTNGSETIGTIEELPELVQHHGIGQVYCADPALPYREILRLVNRCANRTVEFRITANIFPRLNVIALPHDLDAIPSLDLKKTQPGLAYRATKRAMDLVFGAAALLLSLPLWGLIALAIKLDSRGPALLKQPRVGKHGREFTLYKFRTMSNEATAAAWAPRSPTDERVTRVGRVLRRWSLDELPQLWNVVKGEMSLVGPRPEMPFVVAQYEDWERQRLAVKPGLTGLWQILGRKDLPLHENLEYDFYYVHNQSLFLDCTILLRTIPLIIFGRGAY